MRKLFSIILAAIMLLSIVPLTLAEGDDTVIVTKISVTDAETTPTAGRTAGSMRIGSVTINDGLEAASFGDSYWWDNTHEFAFYDDEIFEEGNEYSHVWTVQLDDGYEFADEFVIELNGSADNVDFFGVEAPNHMYFWSLPEKAEYDGMLHCVQIENADIIPVIGGKAGDLKAADVTADGGYNFSVKADGWNRIVNDGAEPMGFDDTFSANTAYFRSFVIEPDGNFTFAENTWVTINGEFVSCRVFSDGTLHTQAGASDAVDHIDIDSVDVYGEDYSPLGEDLAGDHVYFETPVNAKYTLSSVSWYDNGAAAYMTDANSFVVGKEYSLCIRLTANDMYAFSDNVKAYINDDDLIIDTEKTGRNEANAGIFEMWTETYTCRKRPEFIPEIAVTDVDFPPVLGEKPTEHLNCTIPDDAPYTVESVYWYDDVTGMKMKDGDVYTKGHSYSVGFEVVADEDYIFSPNTYFTLNGSMDNIDPEWTSYDEWEPDHYYAWTTSYLFPDENTEDIAAVDVSDFITQPVIGRKASDFSGFTVADDAHYSVFRVTWYTGFGDNLLDDDVFEADTNYFAEIAIVADVGYSFSDKALTITLNGGDDFDAEYSGYINEKVARIVTYRVEAVEEELSTGDLSGDGVINTADAVIVLKYSAEITQLADNQLAAGDTNHDGKVNTADAVMILRYAAGMITEF